MVDQNDLARTQQTLGDRQGPDLVVRNDAAGVSDDVRIALLESEDLVHVQARIYARDYGHAPGWGQREIPLVSNASA